MTSTLSRGTAPSGTSARAARSRPPGDGDTTQVVSGRVTGVVARVVARLQRGGRAASAGLRGVARAIRPTGALLLATAVGGLVAGLALGWAEGVAVAAASLVLILLALPFLFGARAYDADLSLTHERVVAGDDVAGELVVRNRTRRSVLPGRIDLPVGGGLVEFGVPLLRAGAAVARPIEIPGLARGVVRVGPVSTVRTDPVGLFRREHEFDDTHDVIVHPRTVVLPSTSAGLVRDLEGSPTRRLVDADMSFHAIREYVPGDSRRHIHWRSTARTGKLMVRQYEESRRSHMAVVLAGARSEYRDADEYELAVSCAASLGVRALRDAREVTVVTGTDVPRVVRGRLRSIRRLPTADVRPMLDAFSGVTLAEGVTPLGEVCRLVTESAERMSIAFLVTGSVPTLRAVRQAALAFPTDTAVVAVVCDARAHPRVRRLAGLTVLSVGTLDDLAGLLRGGGATW
jgi:hypothetical protein